jgi:hypothetical protein
VTDREAQMLLAATHKERKVRGFMRAFADEIEALASSLGHRSPDRVAADLREISSQMEEVGLGTSGFVNGWIRQRAEDEARRQEVLQLKRRNAL